MAGVKPADVDVAQLYDSFTITVAAAPRGPRLLRQGRGRRRSSRTGALGPPGGGAGHQHQRRRARPTPTRGCTACSCSSRPTASCGARPAPARWRAPRWPWPTAAAACCRPCRRSCSGTEATPVSSSPSATRFEPPVTPAEPFWDATREERLRAAVVPRLRAAVLVPAAGVPHVPRPSLEWRPATGRRRGPRRQRACRARQPGDGRPRALRGRARRAGRGRADDVQRRRT